MFWARNQKKKKEKKTVSLHSVFAPLDKHYAVSKQTACSMTKPNTGLSVAVLLLTPFLLGERFTSVYLVLCLFFLVFFFFLCFLGLTLRSTVILFRLSTSSNII